METALTDAQLVERALAGDQDGYRLLVSRHQAAVYNLLARMLRHPALAQDLAQETFLRAFSHLGSFDPRFKFTSWILRIAHNLGVDALRRKAPAEVPLDPPDAASQARMQAALVDPRSDDASRRVEQRDLARDLGIRPRPGPPRGTGGCWCCGTSRSSATRRSRQLPGSRSVP